MSFFLKAALIALFACGLVATVVGAFEIGKMVF
jgi:hypothetical protein